MDHKLIETLMEVMAKHKIKKLHVKDATVDIAIELEGSENETPVTRIQMPQPSAPVAVATTAVQGEYVVSPMVGTFYAAPSVQAAAFVKVGDVVKADSVLCIVEAMKVMNEVKANISGTIAEILVKNGDIVECGTKLFRIV